MKIELDYVKYWLIKKSRYGESLYKEIWESNLFDIEHKDINVGVLYKVPLFERVVKDEYKVLEFNANGLIDDYNKYLFMKEYGDEFKDVASKYRI